MTDNLEREEDYEKDEMNPDQATEEFLKMMKRETGVSQKFLDAARPLVRRAFIEVPKDRLASCLEKISTAMSRQAEIERLASEAKEALTNAECHLKQAKQVFSPTLFSNKSKQLVN